MTGKRPRIVKSTENDESNISFLWEFAIFTKETLLTTIVLFDIFRVLLHLTTYLGSKN